MLGAIWAPASDRARQIGPTPNSPIAAMTRLTTVLPSDDPSEQRSAAWAGQDLLRQLLQAHVPTPNSRDETAHRRTGLLIAAPRATTG